MSKTKEKNLIGIKKGIFLIINVFDSISVFFNNASLYVVGGIIIFCYMIYEFFENYAYFVKVENDEKINNKNIEGLSKVYKLDKFSSNVLLIYPTDLMEASEEERKKMDLWRVRYEKIERKKQKLAVKRKKLRIKYVTVVLFYMLVLICRNNTTILAFWDKVVVQAEVEEVTGTDVRDSQRDEKQKDGKQEDERQINYINKNKTFHLDDLYVIKQLDDEEKAAFFFLDDALDFDVGVDEHMAGIINADEKDTYTDNLTDFEEMEIQKASNEEIIFYDSIKKVKEYAAEGNFQKWKNSLVHSSDLENDIIEPRRSLADSGKCNATLAFLLANNYQCYALEYQNQDGDSGTVLYYYVKSIIWTEKALKYKTKFRKKYYNYLRKRYKDLKDYLGTSSNYKKYRLFAKKVFKEMKDYAQYKEKV